MELLNCLHGQFECAVKLCILWKTCSSKNVDVKLVMDAVDNQ